MIKYIYIYFINNYTQCYMYIIFIINILLRKCWKNRILRIDRFSSRKGIKFENSWHSDKRFNDFSVKIV